MVDKVKAIAGFGAGGGGSSSKVVLGWAFEDQVVDNTIEYVCPFGGSMSTSLSLRRMTPGSAMTITKMTVKISSMSGETNATPYTLYKNGVATSLVVTPTLNVAGVYSETGSISIDDDDDISIEIDNTGNTGATRTTSITLEGTLT